MKATKGIQADELKKGKWYADVKFDSIQDAKFTHLLKFEKNQNENTLFSAQKRLDGSPCQFYSTNDNGMISFEGWNTWYEVEEENNI